MKTKTTLLLSVIVAIVFGLFLLHSEQKSDQNLSAKLPDTNEVLKSTMQPKVVAPQTSSTANIATPKESGPDPMTANEANAKLRQTLEARNKLVELWGKVVDQDGVPLSSVTVKTEINHFVWPPEQSPNGLTTKQELTSDSDGRFHVSDISATGIHIMLQKAGYEQESRNGYGSNGQNGSQDNPAILRMWSTNVHEKLITGENKFKIVPDGRTYVIDLARGAISESGTGDLKVWVKRPDQITFGKKYDWSCEVDAIAGGLLEEDDPDRVMYTAPTDDYTQSFQFQQKIGSGWGDTTGPKQFFVKLNNGQEYGRITIELFAYYNDQIPSMIRLSYAINPSGSRILR